MQSRRKFIKTAAISSVALSLESFIGEPAKSYAKSIPNKPLVISTWKNGIAANDAAWKILSSGGRALDAVESGVRINEANPEDQSVGYGGRPDRDGVVTLDACIMDENSNIGAVAFLENIKHPISVARAVMEKTPHVILVGKGAFDFAIENGFEYQNLLTEKSKEQWYEWLKKSDYKPKANIENHDTIGMLALDSSGNLSGACTTSGLAYKMHGRVGDSPIIGAGLFVDNEIGAASATGHGEEVIRIAGSHTVVELMRQGRSPLESCEEAVKRIVKSLNKRGKNIADYQVAFIAVNKNGEYGAFAIQKGFNYAIYSNHGNNLSDSKYLI